MKQNKHDSLVQRVKQLQTTIKLLVFLVLVCTGIFYFTMNNPHLRCFGTLLPTNSNVEKFAHLQFPESATNITYELEENGQLLRPFCTMWLQFKLDPDHLEVVEDSSLASDFEIKDIRGYGRGIDNLMKQENWIQAPNSLASFGSSTYPYVSQFLFVDTSQSDEWIIYAIIEEQKDCQLLIICL